MKTGEVLLDMQEAYLNLAEYYVNMKIDTRNYYESLSLFDLEQEYDPLKHSTEIKGV